LIDELRDLYSAENQLVKALPKTAKGTDSTELKEIFRAHLEETKGHVERLKQVFTMLGKKPTGKHCEGMEGAIKEVKEALEGWSTMRLPGIRWRSRLRSSCARKRSSRR
jgi:ferritin-like metal-binding protein YciE